MSDQSFETMRRAMVASQLRTSAVNDPRVVAAMAAVPRERFVPADRTAIAYADFAVPLGNGRALSPPMAVGRMLTELHPQPADRALVIGAATGYSAALLARLVASVVALEEDAGLPALAAPAPAGVERVEGPLNAGWAGGAPYDLILIDGAVEAVPPAIVAQLADGGRLAAAIVEAGVSRLSVGRRVGGGFGMAAFADADAPPLPGFAPPPAFSILIGGGSSMRLAAWWGAALAGLCAAGAGQAETLREALVSAYNTNPTLTGSRAGQRAIDEGVAIAKAGARPSLGANASYTENLKRNSNAFTAPTRLLNAGLSADLPIYQGGAVKNAIRAAEARVDAGRADLRSDESSVFTAVVSAYMDVIRDEAIVELNANNVKVLETNLQATRDRFQVGDLTRTDVAQSEARLAIAQSQLESSQAQLVNSRETYLRVVGHVATALEPPPPLPAFPANADEAVDVATENNPSLIAVKRASQASGYDIRVAKAARLPRIAAVADGSYVNYLHSIGGGSAAGVAFANAATSLAAGAQLTLPLYQGGLPAAQVRRAQAVASQQLELVVEVERGVIAQTRAALSSYSASQAVIRSSETAVSANELALEGVRAEQSVGTRDVLDVLNAEQELLNSRVQLVGARHDSYVAGFVLLAALGRAEARDLGLDGVTLYDPVLNYNRVRNKISDYADDPAPTTQATRTTDDVVGPQGPVIVPQQPAPPVTPVPN